MEELADHVDGGGNVQDQAGLEIWEKYQPQMIAAVAALQ